MAEPTKDYRVWIRVKLTDELLPSPVLSREGLEEQLRSVLDVGGADSPIVSISVDDPRR